MKNILGILLFVVFVTNSYSQDKNYFDAPFGAGGGFLPGLITPNFSTINDQITKFGAPNLSKSGFFATGGAGYVYLGFIPGLRIGGMGIGGSTKESALINSVLEEVDYASGFGGFTAEYTLPWFRKFGVSVGAIIGGGHTSMTISRHQGSFDWNGMWNEISNSPSTTSFTRTLNNSYFTLAPTLNIDIPAYRLLAFRVGAGYAFAFGKNWTMDDDIQLNNVPGDVKGGGLFIVTGLFLGFFSY